ncbi:MAG: hypothetical protein ACLUGQ_07965 [Coprococcus sp.]
MRNTREYFHRNTHRSGSLSGIGDYTAGAIASICFDAPIPAVDGNVLRVYSRLLADDANIDLQTTKKRITRNCRRRIRRRIRESRRRH